MPLAIARSGLVLKLEEKWLPCADKLLGEMQCEVSYFPQPVEDTPTKVSPRFFPRNTAPLFSYVMSKMSLLIYFLTESLEKIRKLRFISAYRCLFFSFLMDDKGP